MRALAIPPCFANASRRRPRRVLTHPDSVTGAPDGDYSISRSFTTAAYEGASARLSAGSHHPPVLCA